MYGALGMSAPSLHRESTDSLIVIALILMNNRSSQQLYSAQMGDNPFANSLQQALATKEFVYYDRATPVQLRYY